MSDTDVAELRVELRQLKADMAEVQETVRELRDLLLQAKGGVALARWIFGGTLASGIAVAAALYSHFSRS